MICIKKFIFYFHLSYYTLYNDVIKIITFCELFFYRFGFYVISHYNNNFKSQNDKCRDRNEQKKPSSVSNFMIRHIWSNIKMYKFILICFFFLYLSLNHFDRFLWHLCSTREITLWIIILYAFVCVFVCLYVMCGMNRNIFKVLHKFALFICGCECYLNTISDWVSLLIMFISLQHIYAENTNEASKKIK